MAQDDKDLRFPTMAGENLSEGITVITARESTDLKDLIRIFTDQEDLLDAAILETLVDETHLNTELVVYTDGSCINNGTEEARAGSGVWYGGLDLRNVAIHVPGKKQLNQVGELVAILHAVKTAPGNHSE